MKLNRYLFLIISLPLLTACGTNTPDIFTLKIIQTTDTHGAIFPYDFINDETNDVSLAQAVTLINHERESNEVILLDGGDILQGEPPVYYYNYEATNKSHVCVRAMNYMKYDAGVVGNHDIEAGHSVYDKLSDEFNFPWLAANAVDVETGEPYFQPYVVIERYGYKVAVLGLITPGIPHWLPENIWEGIEFEDMIESAQYWVPVIQEKEFPDLIVGLFHSGVDYTYNGASIDDECNENASLLVAEQVPGFDIIFVGHDHAGWNFSVTNDFGEVVLVLGGSDRAKNLSVATLTITNTSDGFEYLPPTGELIELSGYSADVTFLSQLKKEEEAVKDYVSAPIGFFTDTISSRESLFGDSAFVDLIHVIQLELTGADISFAAPLKFDAEISAGEIFVRDMFNLYKYENLLYTMELSGQEILDYLEYSYENWMDVMEDTNGHLIRFERDDNGEIIIDGRYGTPQTYTRYYNYESAAGIMYTVDVSSSSGNRVTIEGLTDGREFDLSEMYTVAVNSYRGNGGGGHLTDGAGIPEAELADRVIGSTERDLRYFLKEWILNQGSVTPEPLGNWTVIPKEYWTAGKEKDYLLLFDSIN